MLHTLPLALARIAARRLNLGASTARSVPIKQMVRFKVIINQKARTDHDVACAICGKANSKSTAAAPVIAGQKFTLK